MTVPYKWVLAIGAPVSVAVAAGIWVATASPSAPAPEPTSSAPRPPWVRADGSEDPSKYPKRIEVAGPDGDVLRDANGKPITVPFDTGAPHRQSQAEKNLPKDDSPRRFVKDSNGAPMEIIESDDYGAEDMVGVDEGQADSSTPTRTPTTPAP